jgi:hypothetical protein
MGSRIEISRLDERFSSHTQAQEHPCHRTAIGHAAARREKLIEALVEVIADVGDPRLQ